MASRQSKVSFWYHFVFMFFLSFFAWSCKAVVFITPQLWHHYLRSQIKFCLLQVSVYKLALSQHIFLEDMEKWKGRSSLSIVESFLCCAARYGNCWERFRTPCRHVNEYFYTDTQSFVIITAVPLTIEWFFSGMSIAIETHYQNRPVIAVEKTVETASHCGDNKRVAHCCLEKHEFSDS